MCVCAGRGNSGRLGRCSVQGYCAASQGQLAGAADGLQHRRLFGSYCRMHLMPCQPRIRPQSTHYRICFTEPHPPARPVTPPAHTHLPLAHERLLLGPLKHDGGGQLVEHRLHAGALKHGLQA